MSAMLKGDRRRIELAFSLLFTLPGTPMIQYGDEIGIWDDLSLPERECARTAMQWSGADYGGFSRSPRRVVPIVDDETYGYRKMNVADQRRDPNSLLNWTERRIRARKELPEIGWGQCDVLDIEPSSVLGLRFTWRDVSLVTLHNFCDRRQEVRFEVGTRDGTRLYDVFDEDHSKADEAGRHRVVLEPFMHKWLRVGSSDTTPMRSRL